MWPFKKKTEKIDKNEQDLPPAFVRAIILEKNLFFPDHEKMEIDEDKFSFQLKKSCDFSYCYDLAIWANRENGQLRDLAILEYTVSRNGEIKMSQFGTFLGWYKKGPWDEDLKHTIVKIRKGTIAKQEARDERRLKIENEVKESFKKEDK